MLPEAFAIVLVLFLEHPFLTAILLIALEVPRYTLAILSIGMSNLFKVRSNARSTRQVTAIVPTYNGGTDIRHTLDSLLKQSIPIHEIIIVDDGSDDGSCDCVAQIMETHAHVQYVRHEQRAGKSAAINHAAYLASGDLLLIVDNDTSLEPDACVQLATAFDDPDVAAATGNLLVNRSKQNPLTALQSLEYMLAISIGRGFLSQLNALSCCSGAFSMFQKHYFRAVGGMNVGPGEDLEITLRLRAAGYKIRFVDSALAQTTVPQTVRALFRQRLRWDGDAVGTRLLMYRELSFFKPGETWSGVLQRLDYIFLELLPTIIFPFYLAMLWIDYGQNTVDVLVALYVVLFWLYALNIALAIIITRRAITWLDILVFPLMPLYQGFIMRLVRLVAISDEILLARSRTDALVPEHVRQALYKNGSHD